VLFFLRSWLTLKFCQHPEITVVSVHTVCINCQSLPIFPHSLRSLCSLWFSEQPSINFYVLLTMHPNIMIVFFFTNLLLKFFILIHLLHFSTCFEHYFAHLQEGRLLVQHLVWSLSLGDCSVHRLRESSHNLCTEQSPKESDNTRCCTNTIVLLKMSIVVHETCRGM